LIDAGVLFLYYAGATEVKPYFKRIISSAARGFISEVNLAEVYYNVGRLKRIETADVWYQQIRQGHFHIVPPDESITREAALWKIKTNDLSLADCYALATMKGRAEVMLTTDPDFELVKGLNVVIIPVRLSGSGRSVK
jgi:predicted nucleic acid-binding protein